MGFEVGILFALAALVFWGIGDFFIQKSTRKLGDWETLFIIVLFGAIILTPFVYKDFAALVAADNQTFLVLLGTSAVLLIAALLDFEALKEGKISIVEPVYALEVPVAAILAFGIINEGIEILEIFVISVLLLGLVMVSLKSHHFSRKAWVERGVILAAVGAVFMGASNFLVGFASRITNPLLTNWFINIFISVMCLFYLISNKRLGKMSHDVFQNKKIALTIGTLDNFAWISFAIALTLAPIAIAVAISESYIALAALLGLLISKEKLMLHQKLGLVTALSCVVILALLTG